MRTGFAIIVPILTLFVWWTKIETSVRHGTTIRIPVEGYDPRDLLAGHYVRFNVTLGSVKPCEQPNQIEACVCFASENGSDRYSPIWGGECSDALPSCPALLRGTCHGSSFDSGVDRYSISEDLAPALQRIPPNSTVIVALDDSGQAHVVQLLVDDEKIEDFAARMLSEISKNTPNVQ